MANPLRVLIIEDLESDAELALLHLEKAGYAVSSQRIETAEAMQAALDTPGWDIILSDYALPSFSAPAALKLLQASGLDIPFIIVSGTIDEETAIDLMRAGASDYLMKDRLARLGPLVKRELDTARVRRERNLSEEKFTIAFHASPDSININRLSDGLYLEINEGFKALTGYTDEEVLGKTSLEINIWNDPQDRARLVEGLRLKGEVNNLEAQFRGKDGTCKTCLMSARLIEIDGEPCILSITRDINERKRAEEALHESEEHIHMIFETLSEGVALNELIFNEAGEAVDYKIIEVNDAFYRVADLRTDSPVIGSVATSLYGMDRETIRNFYEAHKAAHETVLSEYISPISQRTFSISTSPFINNRFVTSFRDITGTKQVENTLKEQLEELRRWHAVTLGREKRILELKDEVNQLLLQAGLPARYASAQPGLDA